MATSTSETDGSKGGSDDPGKTSRVKGGEAASEETKDDELRRLRLQVFQLKNIIKKLTTTTTEEGRGEEGGGESDKGRSKKKAGRTFDHRLYKRRHVLLKVAYFGWDYHGFAVQENTGRTIEGELFRALALTRLIESRETSNYHRCGRTDRGVSAWHQVVSIDVRTNLADGVGVVEYEGCRAHERNRREGGGRGGASFLSCALNFSHSRRGGDRVLQDPERQPAQQHPGCGLGALQVSRHEREVRSSHDCAPPNTRWIIPHVSSTDSTALEGRTSTSFHAGSSA